MAISAPVFARILSVTRLARFVSCERVEEGEFLARILHFRSLYSHWAKQKSLGLKTIIYQALTPF